MATHEARQNTLPIITITDLLRITAATAVVILCTLLPFLPGRYDSLAVPLSSMAQVIGTAGIVLVPVGVVWMVAERSQHGVRWRRVFAILTAIVSSLVWAVVCLTAVLQSGFALGCGAFALWGFAARRAWRKLTRVSAGTPDAPTALPVYLIGVPVAVASLQMAVVRPAVEYSRNRAIRNGAPLIAAIEQHRATYGRYPAVASGRVARLLSGGHRDPAIPLRAERRGIQLVLRAVYVSLGHSRVRHVQPARRARHVGPCGRPPSALAGAVERGVAAELLRASRHGALTLGVLLV